MAGILAGLYSYDQPLRARSHWEATNSEHSTIVKRNAIFLSTIFVGAFATEMYDFQELVAELQGD